MKVENKWFVKVIHNQKPESMVVVCETQQEAEEIAEGIKAKVVFDPATDRIEIYRGEDWASAKLFK